MPEISTKPYLLRAIYEWCTDNGYTPYVAVMVDANTRVPKDFVKNDEIVLNISFTATSGLRMENDTIHFQARFGGVAREIVIPVDNVLAIYARENGQGMAFEVTPKKEDDAQDDALEQAETSPSAPILTAVPSSKPSEAKASPKRADKGPDDDPKPSKKGGRPTLTRIK